MIHRDAAMFLRLRTATQSHAPALYHADSAGINMGCMPSTRGARDGIRVRIRLQHRDDEEHPEQHRVQ